MDVPGLASEPKACVNPKLPIGVADTDSLGWVVRPAEPTYAEIAAPWATQPLPLLSQAWTVAVVDDVDDATTVITSDADPVE